jgi:hypothetical protein
MKDILKTVFDYVFSFETFVALFCVGIILSLGGVIIKENERNDLTQARTEACYAQAMVLVQSDAGQRCVAPTNLVKVK